MSRGTRDFSTVGVVGLGIMGAGIAEVFARHGHRVVGVEVDEDALERGRQHVERSAGRAVKRGRLTEGAAQQLVGQITFSSELADMKDCGLVVEAVVEHLPVKQQILRALDDVVPVDAVLATNTSSLSVTEISTASSHPGRVVGLHFFNPAPVQRLVEVIHTVVTDPRVVQDTAELARSLGKTPVVVGDRAGFIANALLFGYLNHAAAMFESKQATREDLDAAMRHGCGYPMGPLALLDLIGLDTAYEILETMYSQSRDRLHAPAPILRQMTTAGMLGRKAGRGFYTYEGPNSPVVVEDALTPDPVDQPKPRRDISSVGVVGTGTTASGIVEVFARAAVPVTYVGRSDAEVDGVRERILESLETEFPGGTLDESTREEVESRLSGSTSLGDLRAVDLVVEAGGEDLQSTTTLFRELDRVCRAGAILATSTSSFSVISLAKVTGRPQDVVGMHFLDPAPATALVEVVSTVRTSPEVTEAARALCHSIGTRAVCCGDRAGFLVNALLFPYLNDAVRMLEARYATADDIDTAMKHGCALPTGPFELLDLVGNDVSLAIQRQIYLEFREPGFAPAPLLEHLVAAGHLGRKTHRGFHDYTKG